MRQLFTALAALVILVTTFANAVAETRVALVVGNSAYQSTTVLANPGNDAQDMTAALKRAGFTVIEALDADKRKFDAALRSFADKLAKADVALFFYAGHGLQVGLQNYLVPVDAKLERERDLEFEAVKLDFVLRQMEIDREGKMSIVILDACRDNPLARNLARSMGTRSTAIGRGLAPASTGLGTFIAYSTHPGYVALDGEGRNSPFTAALVKHMGVKGRNLPATMIEVRKEVVAATNGKQVPWDHSALTGDFYFVPGASGSDRPAATPPSTPPPTPPADVAALEEKLRKLEADVRRREADEEARRRAAAAPPPNAPNAPNSPPVVTKPRGGGGSGKYDVADAVRIDGLKISEMRQPSPAACQESCERDGSCVAYQHGIKIPVMGQCVLFSRVDTREQDRAWRSGVREASAAPTTTGSLPESIRATLTRKERGFDIYEGVSVMGDQIKMSATDNPNSCQVICRNTPGCVAATYNEFFRGKNLACQVFRNVKDVIKTPSATMMVRTD